MGKSKTYQNTSFIVLLFVLSMMTFISCATVKPYQRMYLNDSEMEAGTLPVSGIEEYIQTIREGASGGGAVKGSGGCGCN